MSSPFQNTNWETIKAKSIVEALEAANTLRGIFGEQLLDDLPLGIPADSSRCILANAFNFDCEVACINGNQWTASFNSNEGEKANKLAEILDTKVTVSHGTRWTGTTDLGVYTEEIIAFHVALPESIGQIAYWFDSGRLPEYVE
jgi:hypothetical protein